MRSFLLILAIGFYSQTYAQSDGAVLLRIFEPGESYVRSSSHNMETNSLYIPTYNETKKELKIHSYQHRSNKWDIIFTDSISADIEYQKYQSDDYLFLRSPAGGKYQSLKILKIKDGKKLEDVYTPFASLKKNPLRSYAYIGNKQLYIITMDPNSVWEIDLQSDAITEHPWPSPNGRELLLSDSYRAIDGNQLIFTLKDFDAREDLLVYSYETGKGYNLLSEDDTPFLSNFVFSTNKYNYARSRVAPDYDTRWYRTEKGKFDLKKIYDSEYPASVRLHDDHFFLKVDKEAKTYSIKDDDESLKFFASTSKNDRGPIFIDKDNVAMVPTTLGSTIYVYDRNSRSLTTTGSMPRYSYSNVYGLPERGKAYMFENHGNYRKEFIQLNPDGSTYPIDLGVQNKNLVQNFYILFSKNQVYYTYEMGGKFFVGAVLEKYANLKIKAFVDQNANGILDGSETVINRSGVSIMDPQTESSTEVGDGGITLPKYYDKYELRPKAPAFYELTTDTSFFLHPKKNQKDTTIYVGIKKVKDALVASTFMKENSFRCGFPGSIKSTVVNSGSIDFNGIVKMDFHPAISVKTFDIQPDSSNGSTYYWTISKQEPFKTWSVKTKVIWPGEKYRDSNLNISTWAKLSSGSFSNIVVNETFDEQMGCAYDPNDKAVSPSRPNGNNAIFPGEAPTYKIRFQNTGNDTAFNVRLVDTLSKHLDWETFSVLDQSHDMNTKLGKDGVVEFMFNNILLPDSNRDEPNSHGYVLYRIQPLKNLPFYTEIYNKADIFFDYNLPITTDTTKSVYRDFLVSDKRPPVENELFSIYPNPTKDFVIVEFSDAHVAQVKVISSDGRVQLAQTIQSGEQLDLHNLQPGLYFLEANVGSKTQMAKMLKQ